MEAITILTSLFGPFLLWPVEYFLPYPYVIEELFKTVVVVTGSKKLSIKNGVLLYFFCAVTFSLSESVLYSVNIFLLGNPYLFFIRFAATGLLHSVTFILIYLTFRKNKYFGAFGTIASMAIHYYYNFYILSGLLI